MYIPSRFVKVVSPLAIAIALTACGGGSSFGDGNSNSGVTDPGTGGERPTQTAKVAAIDIIPDSTQLLSTGSKPVTITVNPKDENGVVLEDAEVEYSVDKGATLIVNGNTAVLTPGSANEGEDVTVTIKSGDTVNTVTIKVIKEEEQVQGGETVDSIDLRYDSKHLLFDGSKALNITAIAKNDDNVAISADVKFSATGNVTLEVSGNSVKVTSDGANPGETVTVTAQSGNIIKTLDLLVIRKEEQAESDIKLGSSSGSSFEAGTLAIQKDHLKPGEQTLIKVFLVDTTLNNELVSEEATISFNSQCIAEGTATISDVEFNSGVATVNYVAKGCAGTDTVTATAVVGGKTISASSDITVDAAIVGSIAFNEAAPANIGLAGMGLVEVSTVSFVVLDTEGNPVINQLVNFSLSNIFGGAYLTNTTAKTDANGRVIARVHSGTKATTIKVLASVDTGTKIIKTESRGLVISTGVADDDSFSVSLQTLNPEALNYDGVVSEIYVQAADHFNNPVPEGTAVYFTTEAGSITSSCFINDKGSCTAEWKSGGTRPTDGRSTITASIQGEETFADANDNGLLDETESFTDVNGDGKYNGLLCQTDNPNCSEVKTIRISKQIDLVMSGSNPTIVAPTTFEIIKNGTDGFNLEVSDVNGQPMPKDTAISVSIKTTGSSDEEPPHSLVSEASYTVGNTNTDRALSYPIRIKDAGTGQSSVMQITVKSPKGAPVSHYVNLVEKGTQQEPELAVDMDLLIDSSQILLDGSKPVAINAIIKDANNNVLTGIPVLFSVDNGGTLTASSTSASLVPSTNAALGDDLIVTATVLKSTGNIVKTVTVKVVDTLDQTESKASSLDFSASSRQLFSGGKDPIILSAVVKDKNNNTLTDEVVTFSVDNGGTITVGDNNSGVVKTATLEPGSSKANRTLSVTATVGGLEPIEILVDVVGTKLSVDGPQTIAIDKPTDYTFKLQDSDDQAIADADVTITTNLGTVTPLTGRTDSSGQLKVTLNSDAGGTASISATALNASVNANKDVEISGNDFTLTSSASDIDLDIAEIITVEWLVDGDPKVGEVISVRSTRGTLVTSGSGSTVTTDADGKATFTVQSDTAGITTITAETATGLTTSLNREFVATTPKYLNAQASPSLISPNKSSTIITKVRDEHDNPVKNVKVKFNLTDTVNGQLSDSQAVTDSLGRAEVVYTAGNSSSALDGVKINTSFVGTSSTVEDLVSLTVGGDALRIVLGSDENLEESGIFYKKTFGVIVTDSAGNPIKDQKVDFTIAATHYNKGYMTYDILNKWSSVVTRTCPAEDFDHNGNLDEGEDENKNGTLEPTQAATVTGTGTTDAEGKMTVEVVYPQSEAIWSIQRLTATTVVEGTEYVENTSFTLNMTGADAEADGIVPNVTYYNEDRNRDGQITYFSEDVNGNGILDSTEDVNQDGKLQVQDVTEDTNHNGRLDLAEDVNNNNILDTEDTGLTNLGGGIIQSTVGNGRIDTEDANGNGILDIADGEDLNGNGTLDTEDTNGNNVLDTEDTNRNGVLDPSEDVNNNGTLDTITDVNNDGIQDLGLSEDLNNNGILDARYKGSYGYASDCTNPN